MVDLQTISITIAAASFVAGVIYNSLQTRHQTKMRQTDLIIRLYSIVVNKDFLEAWEAIRAREITSFEEYKAKYSFYEINRLNTIFCELGMLLQKNLIDIDLVTDLTGDIVTIAWKKLKPLREHVKKERGLESDSFDYLYNEMNKK